MIDIPPSQSTGWSALFFCAENGDVQTTESLLKAGANASLKDKVHVPVNMYVPSLYPASLSLCVYMFTLSPLPPPSPFISLFALSPFPYPPLPLLPSSEWFNTITHSYS